MNKERVLQTENINFSPDLAVVFERVRRGEMASQTPERLRSLFEYLSKRVSLKIETMANEGVEVLGPDWCRDNPDVAGKEHASVIIAAYGSTYALPNKDPEFNARMLKSGSLEMFLMRKKEEFVGTACMVIQEDGWAELGRAASLGRVGNELIQDLRILKWITDPEMTASVVGIFATCRTAPDRNIGSEDEPVLMRGGLAVSNMWSKFPDIMVGGFGPLYKKHGALEQFAYAFVSNRDLYVPQDLWVLADEDKSFVMNWLDKYSIATETEWSSKIIDSESRCFGAGYPPLETGITHLVHGEVTLGGEMTVSEAMSELERVKVPFVQVQVPVNKNTLGLQKWLRNNGFRSFIFTPGVVGGRAPLLWFGRKDTDTPVISTYWDADKQYSNPFWERDLAIFASNVAAKW